VTGRVLPIWEAPRPAWLEDALLPYLSLVDRGRYAAALGPGRWLCGTNMAIRRAALADVGGFPDDLGRTDGTLRSMEEVVVQRWLEARGLATRYDPALVVRHRVPAARMTPAWFERRALWQGVSSARCERHCAGVLAARPWLCFAGFTAGLAARAWTLAGRGRPRGLARRCEALMRAGYVLGWSGLVA
jgi:hypothetical protein